MTTTTITLDLADRAAEAVRELNHRTRSAGAFSGPAELYRLARAAAAVKPSLITNCVLLGGIGNVGGASVVLPYVDQAQRMGDLAREDATLESCD